MFVSGEIIRGTTPKHEFLLPFDEETIKLANQLEIDTSNYVILSEEELEERIKQMEENNNAKKQK